MSSQDVVELVCTKCIVCIHNETSSGGECYCRLLRDRYYELGHSDCMAFIHYNQPEILFQRVSEVVAYSRRKSGIVPARWLEELNYLAERGGVSDWKEVYREDVRRDGRKKGGGSEKADRTHKPHKGGKKTEYPWTYPRGWHNEKD